MDERKAISKEENKSVADNNEDYTLKTSESPSRCLSAKSLSQVFLAETARLKRIIAGLGIPANDADDILQNISVQVLNKPLKYEDEKQALRWLIKVTVNQCLSEHRRKKRFIKKATEILNRQMRTGKSSMPADIRVINDEELEAVRITLQQMDPELLTVLSLQYFSGLNSTEIGKILNLNPVTVRSRSRTARMLLAKKLIEKGIKN